MKNFEYQVRDSTGTYSNPELVEFENPLSDLKSVRIDDQTSQFGGGAVSGQQTYGINQPRTTQQEVMVKVKEIGRLNKQAMQGFKLGEKETPLKLLQRAEKQCETVKQYWYHHQKELGDMLSNLSVCKAFTTTYNNLGVFFKQQGKTNQAIKYLKQVLEIEQEMTQCDTKEQDIASTFVNICSIYSEMGKHDIALTYITKAVAFLEEAYEHKLHSMVDPKERRQFVQIVATAFHNAAVEYEFLKIFDKCLHYYQKSFGICLQHLGAEHPLTQTFEKSLIGAQKKVDTMPSVPTKLERKDRSQIIIGMKPPKRKVGKSVGVKTSRANKAALIKKHELSIASLSPMNYGNHKGKEISDRNIQSMSHVTKPLPYLKNARFSQNSNIDVRRGQASRQMDMSDRSMLSVKNPYDDRLPSKDRQEYFSIRDLLEQSRQEIREDLDSYMDLTKKKPFNLKNIYQTLDTVSNRSDGNSRNVQQRGKSDYSHHTLNLMMANNPDKTKMDSSQDYGLKAVNKKQDESDPKRGVSSKQQHNIQIKTLSNQNKKAIKKLESSATIDQQIEREQQQLMVKQQVLRHITDLQNASTNKEQGGQEAYNETISMISNESRSVTPLSLLTPTKLPVKANNHSIIDNARESNQQLQTDKQQDLDKLIDNLKKDLNLQYPNPRSPQKFIDKTEYIKTLDPSEVKKLRNATVAFKSMFKAKLHLANFQRAYQMRKIAFTYVKMFNCHQKLWLKKILREAAELRIKQKKMEEKRVLIREKDSLLDLIEKKQSPNNDQSVSPAQRTIKIEVSRQGDMKFQKMNIDQQEPIDKSLGYTQKELEMQSLEDYEQPIVIGDTQEELRQIQEINSRARRNKLLELKTQNKPKAEDSIFEESKSITNSTPSTNTLQYAGFTNKLIEHNNSILAQFSNNNSTIRMYRQTPIDETIPVQITDLQQMLNQGVINDSTIIKLQPDQEKTNAATVRSRIRRYNQQQQNFN